MVKVGGLLIMLMLISVSGQTGRKRRQKEKHYFKTSLYYKHIL